MIYEDMIKQFNDLLAEYDQLMLEVDRLQTWDGLMSTLDKFYPPEVFVGGTSGDQGPRIIALIREVDRLKKCEAKAEWVL